MSLSLSTLEESFFEELSKQSSIPVEQLILENKTALSKEVSRRNHFLQTELVTDTHYQNALSNITGLPYMSIWEFPESQFLDEFTSKISIRIAKKYFFCPVKITEDTLYLAVLNPWPTETYENIALQFQKKLFLYLAEEEKIIESINQIYDRKTGTTQDAVDVLADDKELKDLIDLSLEEVEDLLDVEDEEPVKRLVNTVLFQAIKSNASDIHVDPTPTETHIRSRIDSVLHPMTKVPKQGHRPLVNRMKVMADLDISVQNKPQDGRTMIILGGRKIDIRVSILPTVHGERVVLRLLAQTGGVTFLSELGMSNILVKKVDQLVHQPHGIILVTGPTGSGKTTTLYSALQKVDERVKNIITVEDPVEYKIEGYGQVQVNEKVGLTFASGLRSILRQDPDVIMIGEIRDAETAQIAIQASLTGHLVLSTLHTNDAPSTVIRLIDMGIEPFLVSSTVSAVISQRLVRTICTHCKIPIESSWKPFEQLNLPKELKDAFSGVLWKGEGCKECLDTGYLGRVGVHEFLSMSDDVRRIIMQTSDAKKIQDVAEKNDMWPLRVDCATKVLSGLTTLEELMRIVHYNSE